MIVSLDDIRLTDTWSLAFKEMGVQKVGVYLQSKTQDLEASKISQRPYIRFLNNLLNGCPDNFHLFVALVSHTGFISRPTGLIFRAIQEKRFLWKSLGVCDDIRFYVSQSFEERINEFRYGQPIVLVEGVLDAECFAYLTKYAYVMASLTSYCTVGLAAFISSLTNKVLLVPDNDQSGVNGLNLSRRNLERFNVHTQYLRIQQKDFGDVYRYKENLDVGRAVLMLQNF